MEDVACKVCDRGIMKPKKKYRLGAFGVIFALLFAVPSIIGVIVGGLGLFATGKVTVEASEEIAAETRADLEEAAIPTPLVEKILAFASLTTAEREQLTTRQRTAVDGAVLTLSVSALGTGAGAAIAGGLSLMLFLGSLVGLVLAWLLTLRKKVLQCTNCGAVVAAS